MGTKTVVREETIQNDAQSLAGGVESQQTAKPLVKKESMVKYFELDDLSGEILRVDVKSLKVLFFF
jgi:hypothetical protein